jgi:hypothetical protein
MFQATYDSNGNDSSTVADTNQQVWDFSIGGLFNIKGASTGGYGKIFAKPTWQTGVPGIAGKFRAVPLPRWRSRTGLNWKPKSCPFATQSVRPVDGVPFTHRAVPAEANKINMVATASIP